MNRNDWDEFWKGVDPTDFIWSMTFHDRILLEYLKSIVGSTNPARVLELGCVNSKNLFRLPLHSGLHTTFFGLDPSTVALRSSQSIYDKTKVLLAGGDIFASPLAVTKFGLIFSFGLIEHYRDPQPFLKCCLELLEPGGILIAGYPSYQGLTGWLQRKVNPVALDHHFSIPAPSMAKEFARAGLVDINSRSFGLFNPNMISWGNGLFRKSLMYACFAAVRPLEWTAGIFGVESLSERCASYIVASGMKPA